MSKSSRRKSNKKKRRDPPGPSKARSPKRRPPAKHQEDVLNEAIQVFEEIVDIACDESVPVGLAIEPLIEWLDGEWPGPEVFVILAEKSSDERLRDLADAAIDKAGRTELTLLMRAFVAALDHDLGMRISLLEEARELGSTEATRILASTFTEEGQIKDALELIRPIASADAEDLASYWTYARAIQDAHFRQTTTDADESCPCGSIERYEDCCRPAERQQIELFLDREPLYALREAINPFLDSPFAQRVLRQQAQSWMELGLGDPHDDEGRLRMFYDWAVVAPDLSAPDDDDSTILSEFAEQLTVPDHLSEAALVMEETYSYGLWLVCQTEPDPGIEMVDLLTATRLYVACAPEQIEGLRHWTVLAGPVFVMDGVWRLGGSMLHLSPGEADPIAALVWKAADTVAKQARLPRGRARFVHLADVPPSAAAEVREPLDISASLFLFQVARSMFPEIIATVSEWRAQPARIANMDGEPILLIEAKIAVEDLDRAVKLLAGHDDFRLDDGEDAITWYGRAMTPDEKVMNRKQLEALAKENGWGIVPQSKRSERWVRGSLSTQDGVFEVSVNSRERLQALLSILDELGCDPRVIDESRVDPSMDLPHIPSTSIAWSRPMPSAQFEAWLDAWLSQHVPALSAMTPLEAVDDDDGYLLLEALLRNWEFSASGTDAMAQLQRVREALDMTEVTERSAKK